MSLVIFYYYLWLINLGQHLLNRQVKKYPLGLLCAKFGNQIAFYFCEGKAEVSAAKAFLWHRGQPGGVRLFIFFEHVFVHRPYHYKVSAAHQNEIKNKEANYNRIMVKSFAVFSYPAKK